MRKYLPIIVVSLVAYFMWRKFGSNVKSAIASATH